jgi:hypothetical protein
MWGVLFDAFFFKVETVPVEPERVAEELVADQPAKTVLVPAGVVVFVTAMVDTSRFLHGPFSASLTAGVSTYDSRLQCRAAAPPRPRQ